MVETGGESRGLAEIAAQLDYGYAAIDGCDCAQHGERVIAGAIVDEHDFEGLAVSLHYRLQAVVEIGHVLLLVVQGNDDRVFGHVGLIIPESGAQFLIVSAQSSVCSLVPVPVAVRRVRRADSFCLASPARRNDQAALVNLRPSDSLFSWPKNPQAKGFRSRGGKSGSRTRTSCIFRRRQRLRSLILYVTTSRSLRERSPESGIVRSFSSAS